MPDDTALTTTHDRHAPQPLALPQLQGYQQLARTFYESGLFQDTKSEAQALVKILRGRELGLQPMAAMTAFDIIQDRVYVKGQTCAALLAGCRYARYQVHASTQDRCVMGFQRYQDGQWVDLLPVEYTLAEAEARGLLVTKKNHKTGETYHARPEWHINPGNMLYWRAIARGTARYFPELLAGLESDDTAGPPPPSPPEAAATIDATWGDHAAAQQARMRQVEQTSAPPAAGSESGQDWHRLFQHVQYVARQQGYDPGRLTSWAKAHYGVASTRDLTAAALRDLASALPAVDQGTAAYLRGEAATPEPPADVPADRDARLKMLLALEQAAGQAQIPMAALLPYVAAQEGEAYGGWDQVAPSVLRAWTPRLQQAGAGVRAAMVQGGWLGEPEQQEG